MNERVEIISFIFYTLFTSNLTVVYYSSLGLVDFVVDFVLNHQGIPC